MTPHTNSPSTRKELSGGQWARRFAGSMDTRDLTGTFRYAVEEFIAAMRTAGIRVCIESTYRPIKRSYLMHWSWRIVNDDVDPATIPPQPGVEIEWQHSTAQASIDAARRMVDGLSIRRLRTKPALRSQHNVGLAIDMSISWTGTVSVKDALGKVVQINTGPRSRHTALVQQWTLKGTDVRFLIPVVMFALSGLVFAKDDVPQDVQAFVRNAEACEHFAGEFDSGLSEARQKELERAVVRYCGGAQNQLKKLMAKYRNDARTMEIVHKHTNESVTSFR